VDLRALRRLVRRRDAREVLDLPRARLLVEPLRVALLGDLDRDVDVDLDEGDGLVALGDGAVQVARDLAVGEVRRDEGRQGCGRGVGEELRDLCTRGQSSVFSFPRGHARANNRQLGERAATVPRRSAGCSHCGPSPRSPGPCSGRSARCRRRGGRRPRPGAAGAARAPSRSSTCPTPRAP